MTIIQSPHQEIKTILRERVNKIAGLTAELVKDYEAATPQGKKAIEEAIAHLIAAKHGLYVADEIQESAIRLAEVS